jgi:tRNA U34 2-thiouridine synthase MnmA/TrmU
MSIAPRLKEDGSRVKAIGLISGGLDSTLAARVLAEQGVDVLGVNFSTGFCRSDHHRAMGALGKQQDPRRLRNEALRAGADLEIPVRIVDLAQGYLDVILRPRHGYGANLNPCVDCRAYMLRAARAIMDTEGADFVFTGEVLGQRPMSQHLQAMQTIERESGLTGFLLRPLSARLLAPTEPERRGWVDRDKLLRIQGRTRRLQYQMAAAAGLDDIPNPAGGCCYLTDIVYASRFADLVLNLPADARPTERDILLLKVGRHFRLTPGLKLIVGREEAENNFLTHFFPEGPFLEAPLVSGPLGFVHVQPGAPLPTLAQRELMAAIIGRYGKGRADALLAVEYRHAGASEMLHVKPLAEDAPLDAYRIAQDFDAKAVRGRSPAGP